MISHFDLHNLGEPLPQPRKCKVKTPAEVEVLGLLIGADNVAACKSALADGAQVWVFRSAAEIRGCAELGEAEKQECYQILQAMNGQYAGWIRRPTHIHPGDLVGIAPVYMPDGSYLDPHGNWRAGPNANGINWQGSH